ncbi:MAG: RNA 2'-phosphotransferase, partial [Anaerolineae bacterium]|nr:RNA 2'-phosphotransferase [Anaerolineae bacterium]
DLVRHSKLLSYVLRHRPDEFGLELGPGGWVSVDAVLAGLRDAGHEIPIDVLREVVATNPKRRFAISDDGLQIRANQGHSVAINLMLDSVEPPAVLWHGTARRFLLSIREQGLLRGSRHHVHLSADAALARTVGSRHGRPVVLKVDSGAMHAAGHVFHVSDNEVWLTEHVPPAFLEQTDL